MNEVINALEESNFILKALHENTDDTILKNGIERRLYKNCEVIARAKCNERKPLEEEIDRELVNTPPTVNANYNARNEVIDILSQENLFNSYQLESEKNKGFITQNIKYFETDRTKYKETIARVQKEKDKIENLQAYTIGALKKEFKKNEDNNSY